MRQATGEMINFRNLQSNMIAISREVKNIIFIELNFNITRMTTFIKTKLKKTDDQTNITEYHIISKLILQRIIISQFMMIRQLSHVKIIQLNKLILTCLN